MIPPAILDFPPIGYRVVAVVVAAAVDDQRPVTDLGESEPGGHYRRPGYPVSVYKQPRQVSLVPWTVGAEMEPCSAWIEVLARLTPRNPLPALQRASQEAEFVDVEAVEAR